MHTYLMTAPVKVTENWNALEDSIHKHKSIQDTGSSKMSKGDGMAKHPEAEPGYGDRSKQPRWQREDKIKMSVQKK